MKSLHSFRFACVILAVCAPVVVGACGSDDSHGPTIGAPSTPPVVVSEGGVGTSGGSSNPNAGGSSNTAGGNTGVAGTFVTGAGGGDPFNTGGTGPFGTGGGDPFGASGTASSAAGTLSSFSGTASF